MCMAMANEAPPPKYITNPLRPDLDAVRRFILAMIKQGSMAILLSSVLSLLARIRDVNQELTRRLEAGRRKRPPSERMRRLQVELPFMTKEGDSEDVDAEGAEAPVAGAEPKPGPAAKDPNERPKPKRGPKNPDRHGRPKLPAHLPRVPEVIPVPDAKCICPQCKVEAEVISYKHAEKLDFKPAEFVVLDEQREVRACQRCHEYVVTAPKPDEVVDRGILGQELLVQATVDHYQDAVPWERMERRARQEGVPLSANTLASSCGRLIDLFDPVVQHIFSRCVASKYFAFDATTMPVIDGKHPLGICNYALWLMQGDHRYSYFMHAASGHADHLAEKLEGCRLASVMCDGSPTNNVVEKKNGAARGGCNAHSRRKLVAALRLGDDRALRGLEIFAAIFHVDAESKRAGETIAQRFERRQRESAPLVAELDAWVQERLRDVEPKSSLGQAVRYIHKQWKRLTRFLVDPLLELTNNEVERDLRTWVLDRKTWLFCGNDQSARRAADALTIITTCKKFGVDPRRYMRDTLKKILAGEKDLAALLPENYKPDLGDRTDLTPAQSEAA